MIEADFSSEAFKWDVKQRLTLLEATVFWTGELVTGFLTRTFTISRVQATKDIALYLSLRPNNLRYDRSLKRYLITEQFVPLLISGHPQECLQVLQATQHAASAVVTLMHNLPSIEVVTPATRQIALEVLRPMLQAARFGGLVEVVYQSMSRPEPARHVLQPKRLVFDGLRWHVRAFSASHNTYRDFVLARVLEVAEKGKAEYICPEDKSWDEWVTVKIGAHPGLTAQQKLVIERDYAMESGVFVCSVRAALLPYWLLAMRIGADDFEREASNQQIVLLNRDTLKPYLGFVG
jgi:predicted DNA-binding transcriptional regulator YafY